MQDQENNINYIEKFDNDLQILSSNVKELNSLVKKDTVTVDNEEIPVFESLLSNGIKIVRENGFDKLCKIEMNYNDNSDKFFIWLNDYVKNSIKRIDKYESLKNMNLGDFALLIDTYFDSCVLKKFYEVTPFKNYNIDETIKIIRNLENLVRKCIIESDSKVTFVNDLVNKFGIDSDKASYLFVLIENNFEKLSMRVLFEQIQQIKGSLQKTTIDED